MKTLVLGLGNELLGDDAVGILAARMLRERLGNRADVVESALSGMALLDLLMGYERAIIIDAVKTGRSAPGTIYELTPEDLSAGLAPSPHYAGLPELIATAKALAVDFPNEIKIFALEVEDPYTIGGRLSPAVEQALEGLVRRVEEDC
ncbi:MAG: hydrogenase maturation protease [Candidatus Bipolaricaulota bacterium]|nr:hydrogenase maturation protease [Candidatus Bipolaricaulota bacterium]MCS7274598.1 hydrogenase maturation protease [Candidatus Bipolaricaulota bacterium]MDW8110971.1 hydrogenase maturation protease [Candidatus Bipolaricaulota bacterium]MDW8329028.1 hydrogenase maturation protease [Candidatus Bipolaricaulota bacterium]